MPQAAGADAPVRRAPERRIPAERMIDRMDWASLRTFLTGATEEREATIARLRMFGLELLRWNQGVSNLVSHDDELRLVDRHITDSLAGLEVLKSLGCKRVVDFGTGGGFPALPLIVAGAGEHWTLVESRRNKTLFLRRAIQELGLSNVDVVTGRLEMLIAEDAEPFRCDGFTSRATMKAAPTLAMAAQIVEPSGHAVLWKGSGAAEELAVDDAWREFWTESAVHPIGEGPNAIHVFIRK